MCTSPLLLVLTIILLKGFDIFMILVRFCETLQGPVTISYKARGL
jgi:hypothetical protein